MTAHQQDSLTAAAVQPSYDDEIDLVELLATVLKKWRWWVGGAVVGGALGLALAYTLPPKYEAEGVVRLSQVATGNQSSAPVESVQEAITRMQTLAFRNKVVDQLISRKLITPDERTAWLNDMDAKAFQPIKNTSFLNITFRSTSPDTARIAVETAVQVLKEAQQPLMDERVAATQKLIAQTKKSLESMTKQYDSTAQSLQASNGSSAVNYLELSRLSEGGTYASLHDKLTNLQLSLEAPNSKAAALVEPAQVADKPVSPKKALLLAAGLVLGCLAGLALAFTKPMMLRLRAKMQ